MANTKHTKSSGIRHKTKATRAAARLKLKIKRWERYTSEVAAGKKPNKDPKRWDTSGLQKHLAYLEKQLEK